MPLKITPHDLTKLQQAVTPLDTPERRQVYIENKFPRAGSTRDKDMRYRWDLLYASGLRLGDGVGMQGDLNLYAYLDDTHIDSALRILVPPLYAQAPVAASAAIQV